MRANVGIVGFITFLIWLYVYEHSTFLDARDHSVSGLKQEYEAPDGDLNSKTSFPHQYAQHTVVSDKPSRQQVAQSLEDMPRLDSEEPSETRLGLTDEGPYRTARIRGSRRGPTNLQDKAKRLSERYDLGSFQLFHKEGGSSRVSDPSEDMLDAPSLPRPVKFPISDRHFIKLPSKKSKIKNIKIQANSFSGEAPEIRRSRAETIKSVFLVSWNQYKKYAWGYDEVKPMTNEAFNPFAGWAATLVDALDTLYIMGLHDEFEEAVNFVGRMDFTRLSRPDIPLFETVIRYLGGLMSAYDLSGQRFPVLLQKADELGENLMGAFDTPNHMPQTFFWWQDEMTSLKFRASAQTVAAEVGSLSVEFTRLAQLTGKHKYYDAVARITEELYQFIMERSEIKGLLPKILDISGCTLLDETEQRAVDLHKQVAEASNNKERQMTLLREFEDLINQDGEGATAATNKKITAIDENEILEVSISNRVTRGHCKTKGMTVSSRDSRRTYTLAGMTDSVYEYYIKEYLLLRGAESKYVDMYLAMNEATRDKLLYRPYMRKLKETDDPEKIVGSQNDPFLKDALLIGSQAKSLRGSNFNFESEMTHLACYAGGMFALGGKVLGRSDDVQLGKRLTKGCIWAYHETLSGVMPETFRAVVCDNMDPTKHCMESPEEEERASQKNIISPIDNRYILRPEALESVFYMYRVTGEKVWQQHGWDMFTSIERLTRVVDEDGRVTAYSAVSRVEYDPNKKRPENPNHNKRNEAESFWLGETLKYAYLLFADESVVSLDEYVLNTEAHPFRLTR